MKNCMVAQSGGPTAAINATLAGVIQGVRRLFKNAICYGAVHGIQGLIGGEFVNLNEMLPDDNALEMLQTTPAMYLGSCRFKLPDLQTDPVTYELIFKQFEAMNVGTFFYIGGNDSMDTVMKLSDYAKEKGIDVKIIGIPKTIDNDLCKTDHTPGFGSAAKYVASTMLEIAHDTYIYDLKSVTIVEIMGRDAGWLTAASALARNNYNTAPHLIYLPERAFSKEQFIADISNLLTTRNNVIVAVSEGIRDENGNYITAGEASDDQFGHVQLSGTGKALEYLVKEKLDVKVRSIEMNVLQRSASHMASKTDINEARNQGLYAVQLALKDMTGVMVCIKRMTDFPYSIEYTYADIHGIANEAKSVPQEWINEAGNDVTSEMTDYLFPLILGEVTIAYANGLPSYLSVEHLKPKNWK